MVRVADAYNFRRIDDRLTTSGLLSVGQLGALGREGYDAVVNLLPESSEHAVADEPGIVEGQGIEYVYIPVDFAAPTGDDLRRFTRAMDALQGRKVHVHCAANYRVSAFCGLYLAATGRWTDAQADALVADLWDPSEHPAWAALIAEARARRGSAT